MVAQVTKSAFSPWIVGVLTAPMLGSRRYPDSVWACDGIELRADGLPAGTLLPAVESFAVLRRQRGFTGPVIFTLRLRRDGGCWEDARAQEREPLWLAVAGCDPPLCDYVDVEIEVASQVSPEVWEALGGAHPGVLLSHHACGGEDPSAWDAWLRAMHTYRPAGVKFAAAMRHAQDVEAMLRFARQAGERYPLSCAIGMGLLGRSTRVLSPLRGCPITYAFLGEDPVAPGQLPFAALRAFFSDLRGAPVESAPESEHIVWAERRLKELGYG